MNVAFRTSEINKAVLRLSKSGEEERGAVFTKKEVVEFILDISGYIPERDLTKAIILEPSFGNGDFLFVIVERLLNSYSQHNYSKADFYTKTKDCIRAVELHTETFNDVRFNLVKLLTEHGISGRDVHKICDAWLINDDFLLTNLDSNFTHVVGNPPYVRQEMVPQVLMIEYRRMFETIYDRADLYIPFIEKGLTLLSTRGNLGFICSDRWMKNRYGGPLRKMISDDYALKYFIDTVGTPVFDRDVSAYAAITVIVKNKEEVTRIAFRPEITKISLKTLARDLLSEDRSIVGIKEFKNILKGDSPLLLNSDGEASLIEHFEKTCQTLEEEGCKVGIGVATGCDRVFIKDIDDLDIEKSRKLPLVTTKDILSGKINWQEKCVVNPFESNGALVDLDSYPKLKKYFSTHKEALENRNVAKRNQKSWYRTIDKITQDLTTTPKLLIPDIKLNPSVVYDSGKYYPHHNLYYVLSKKWDIKALQTVLKSSIAKFFIASYSTKMRGDYFRFQAQYLRRIRIPKWENLSEDLKDALIDKADSMNIEEIDNLVFRAYFLKPHHRAIIQEMLNS